MHVAARPRISISIVVPRLDCAIGTYAIPIAFPKCGVNVPLVTTPTGAPSLHDSVAVTRDATVDHLKTHQFP